MIVRHLSPRPGPSSEVPGRVQTRLREHVAAFARPRHFYAQPAENRFARERLIDLLRGLGFAISLQGEMDNVIARPKGRGPVTLVCAHYDSVPTTPGADDNASALAVLLELAAALGPTGNTAFVGFNREEDGLKGSQAFAAELPRLFPEGVARAHVLEMVGYRSREPGSQRSPLPWLPGVPDVGDFMGVLANGASRAELRRVLRRSPEVAGGPKVVAIQTLCGFERRLPDLARSDHWPLWEVGVPALLWTDTAEFRNPHYHQPSDTPDTLDYAFMEELCRLLKALLV
jgi:Zn-dependent M28 family amino/carboxypeptidase